MENVSLDKEEMSVYNAIKKYLEQNKFFKMGDILNYLVYGEKKTLNLNKAKIQKILRSLIRKGLVIPRSKFTKSEVLNNQIRKKIYDFINQNPGTHFYEILNHLELGRNQTLWHLNMLTKFLYIKTFKIGNRDIYFDFNVDSFYFEICYYLRNEKVCKIIDILKENEKGLKLTELSNISNMHYNTSKKYIEILKNLNLISEIEGYQNNIFQFNQNYYDKIIAIINKKNKTGNQEK